MTLPNQGQWALHHSCPLGRLHLQPHPLLCTFLCHLPRQLQGTVGKDFLQLPGLVREHVVHVLNGRFSAITFPLVSLSTLFPGEARVG